MPGRWLKEAYCTSSRIAEVSPEARDLWLRLVLKADDYGCFHGDAQLVASACFPRQPDAARCDRLLTELAAARLVERYNAAGQPYIAVTQWYERPRSQPKFPRPPPANVGSCQHPPAVAGEGGEMLPPTSTSTSTSTTTTTSITQKKNA